MIRTLTIVENTNKEGKIEYSLNGNLPIDEAAKALIIIAYQTTPPEKEGGSGDSRQP
jgi:hypothetical protein